MRINWLGVLISAIVIVVLRYLWYAYFGGADWAHLATKAIAAVQADQKAAGLSLANALVLSAGLGWLVGRERDRSLPTGIAAGLIAGVALGATSVTTGYIHAGATLKSLLVDGGYLVAAYVLGGAILGAMAPKKSSRPVLLAAAEPILADHGHDAGNHDAGGHDAGHDTGHHDAGHHDAAPAHH